MYPLKDGPEREVAGQRRHEGSGRYLLGRWHRNGSAGSVKAHRSNTSSGSIVHEVDGYWRGLRRWVGLVEGQGIWKIARGTGLCSEVLDNRLGMVVCPSLMEKRITGIIGLDGVVTKRRMCVF